MRIDVLTLFPEMFAGYLNASILNRVQEAGMLQIGLHNLRDYGIGKHRITDEAPYGGGGGMVLKPEPIFSAVDTIIGMDQAAASNGCAVRVVLLSPQGRTFTHQLAKDLAQHERLLLICGRYEGIDERVRLRLIDDEISIGDYVLTGGELPAMVVIDAVARLLPGALGDENAAERDSHAMGLLEGPHYTRPAEFRDLSVPELLRSGHSAKIARWRREQALRRTWQLRPDMLLTAQLTEQDKRFLAVLAEEQVELQRAREED